MVVRWNKGTGTFNTVWSKSVSAATWGSLTLANDIDGDGKPEVISGNRIFDGRTGSDKTPSIMLPLGQGGYSAIGDFNKDGAPDLVFVRSKEIESESGRHRHQEQPLPDASHCDSQWLGRTSDRR